MTGHNRTQNRMTAGRAIISVLALLVVFCRMAAAEQLYVNESGWWRDGGVFNASGAPIQAAVDNATVGDSIFVWNGSYSENVNVYKRLTLEGEGAEVVTVAAHSGDHVFEVTANWVKISGFAVSRGKAGIYLHHACHCNIYDNIANSNWYGIYLHDSSSNILTDNVANSNDDYGIYLSSSSNDNTLQNNTANSNWHGIYLSSSSNDNTLTDNIANLNNIGGIYLWSSSGNTLTDNIANSNNNGGIYIGSSSGNTLTGNIANSNQYGICLSSSSSNTLTDNIANSNDESSIRLYSSNDNALTGNIANLNLRRGIHLSSSSNNTLTNNTANSNDESGIYLSFSSNDTLTNNTANSNSKYGIYLDNADDNNIACNLVQSNTERGFYTHSGSTGNNISYNNIIENGNYNTTTGGWEWQFYNDQSDDVDASDNWWGTTDTDTINASINDSERGIVTYLPKLGQPAPCAPTPEPHVFTAADATIALQISVGSRPPDLRWDVSGDKRVTSLDALMILQAAGG